MASNGKGDKRRPSFVSKAAERRNYDRIFRKKDTMNLYLLTRNEEADFAEANGYVIRAKSSSQARLIAASIIEAYSDIWMDAKMSKCQRLKKDGKPGVIICDYFNG